MIFTKLKLYTALLCVFMIFTVTLCYIPSQRAAIQELTKAIAQGKISESDARKKVQSLKLSEKDLKDQIVYELVVAADSKGMRDILNPQGTPVSVKELHQASPNAAVKQIFDDFTIFSKSIDTFKPGDNYNADQRRLRLMGAEVDRITKTVKNLGKTELNQKDQATISELMDKSLPALLQKLETLEQETELLQEKKAAAFRKKNQTEGDQEKIKIITDDAIGKQTEANKIQASDKKKIEQLIKTVEKSIQHATTYLNSYVVDENQKNSLNGALNRYHETNKVLKEKLAQPASQLVAPNKPVEAEKTKTPQETAYNAAPEAIKNLIVQYVNKEYTIEQVKALRKENRVQLAKVEGLRSKDPRFDQWLDPYEHKNTKEELNEYVQKFVLHTPTTQRTWDKNAVIDEYYYLTLAKPYFKKFNDRTGANRIFQLLLNFLAMNGNDTSLAVNTVTDKTPIKNKYFVEIIDEFEHARTTPTITKQDFPTSKSGKDIFEDERNYLRDESREAEIHPEIEESMSGAGSRIKD